MRPASINSLGMLCIVCRMRKIPNTLPRAGRMMAKWEFQGPLYLGAGIRGIMVTAPGTIIVDSRARKMVLRYLN